MKGKHRAVILSEPEKVVAACACGWGKEWQSPAPFSVLSTALAGHLSGVEPNRSWAKIPNRIARSATPAGLVYWKTRGDRYYAGCVLCSGRAAEVPAGEINDWWERHEATPNHVASVERRRRLRREEISESVFLDVLEKTLNPSKGDPR